MNAGRIVVGRNEDQEGGRVAWRTVQTVGLVAGRKTEHEVRTTAGRAMQGVGMMAG